MFFVGRKVRIIELGDVQREQLTKGYQNGNTHVLRKRCHIVLLKSEGRSSKDISKITATVGASANRWLDRFESEGMAGLCTKAGRGRKPILGNGDGAKIGETVKRERERLGQGDTSKRTGQKL